MILPHYEPVIGWDLIETHLEHHAAAGAIYFSMTSTFWSHQRGHAMALGPDMKDALGGQIYAQKDWRGWLEAARENPGYYGQHGLRALLAGHYQNCRSGKNGGPFAAPTWGPINAALDAWDAEHAPKAAGPKPKIDLTAPKRPAIIPGRKAVRRG